MSEDRFDFRAAFGLPSTPDPNFEVSDLAPPQEETSGDAVSLPEDVGPEEQNLIEFYNPFEGSFQGPGAERPDPTLIPGVRFPKLGTIAEQDFGNFLTIPANIAEERVRFGGDLLSTPGAYSPSTKEIEDTLKEFNLSPDDRIIGKLLRSTSPEDLKAQATVYARREEREVQIAVDNPGLVGLGVRIAWNMADPTFLVAGTAATGAMVARVANSATKTGAAIRFASDGLTKGERFAVGAGAAFAVDVPMEIANTAADPARDPLMTAGFLAVAPLLGGALNALGRQNADVLAEATKRLDDTLAREIRGTDGGAVGAAQAGPVPRAYEDDIPGAPAQAGRFTIGTPLNFLARSPDAITRTLADKLSWNPITGSTQRRTAAEAQKRIYDAQMVRIRAGRMAAKAYFERVGFSPSTEQLDDFFRQVGQHITNVRQSTDPNIIRAADEYREGFADGLAYLKDRNFVPGRDRPTTERPPEDPSGGPAGPPPEAPEPSPDRPTGPSPVGPGADPAVTKKNPYFGRKSFRGGKADTPEAGAPPAAADGATPAAAVSDYQPAIAAERRRKVELYDKALEENARLGKNVRPSGDVKAPAAIGAAVGIGGASTAAWLATADDETAAGAGLFGGFLGAALGAIAAKGRVRSWEMNSPGIAIFLGPDSPGADLKALAKAQELERWGVNRDEVWKKTGWGRDGIGKWVFEADQPFGGLISDLLGDDIPLPAALDGKSIFDVEPDLRKVVLQTRSLLNEMKELGETLDARVEGLADAEAGAIAVNRDMSRSEKLRVLLHELNHSGQAKRGMPAGGVVDDMDLYLTDVAEAEARLVETRIGYSKKKRREVPPWRDYDVPEYDLWAGQTALRAASLGSDLRRFRDPAWFDSSVQTGTFSEGELEGYQYWRSEEAGITAWIEDLGDGEGSWNWDWNTNIDRDTLFSDNPDASPAQSARAFAFAQAAFERLAATKQFDVLTFEGLKKPTKEGQAASGHERVQEFLMARGQVEGYVASKGSWKTKIKDPETKEMIEVTRSSFAFSRDGMDLAEVWQGIRRGQVEITPIEKVQPKAASIGPRNRFAGDPPPDPNYHGLEEARFVDYDPTYLPRRFNKRGWDALVNSPQYRGNLNRLGNRIGDIIYRSNREGLDALAAGRATPVEGQELAWRIGRQYVKTVSQLMNPAQGGRSPFRKVSLDDREAAKEIVRESLNGGELADFDTEEAMEMILDLVAPIRKSSAENPRMRPRVQMDLNAEADGDILDMFEWNAEALYTQYSRTTSGFAGLLQAGFRSEAEVRNMISEVRDRTDFDPQRQGRSRREAEMLDMMVDAILGRPHEDLVKNPHWTWFANQMRRLNFGNLMNNTGFLAISEVLGAVQQVGLGKIVMLFPELQRYYRLARAGDPAVRQNLFYLADAVMGHGSAQMRARLGQSNRWEVEDGSLNDPGSGVAERIDRATRKQANLVGRLSGMTPMQEWLRMTIVTAEAQDWVKAARKGQPLYSQRRMRALGVDEEMWGRISGQLRKFGDVTSPDTRRVLPEMDLNGWDDAEALNVWINALDRNSRRLVLEGDVGHQAFWLRNRPSAQLLLQFLNFPINAFSKHLGFALNTRDGRAGMEALMMSLGGAIGVMARNLATAYAQDTEEEREAYLKDRFTWAEFSKALLYYNAHGSLAPNAFDGAMYIGQQAGLPVEPFFQKTRGSGLPGDPFTGNPTYSRISKSPQVIGDLFTETPFSEQDVQRVVKHFAPLGNHIAMNAILDRMLEFLPDEEGSEEDIAQN